MYKHSNQIRPFNWPTKREFKKLSFSHQNVNFKIFVMKYVKEFALETTIHGVNHIASRRHVLEIGLWLVCLLLAMVGAISLILGSYNRYQANPTVISLEKNYRDWFIPFPAITVCFEDRLHYRNAESFITRQWGNVSKAKQEYYKTYLKEVANIQLFNFENFKNFAEDDTLKHMSIEKIISEIVELHPNFTVVSSFEEEIVLRPVMTEMGICHSTAHFLLNALPDRKTFADTKSTISNYRCNSLTFICYAVLMELHQRVKYYIHSPYELPDAPDQHHQPVIGYQLDTQVIGIQTVSSPQLRHLTPKQRRCNFFDEPDGYFPFSSYSLCRIKCRKDIAISLCGCKPPFYSIFTDGKSCNIQGLLCISQHKNILIPLKYENGTKIPCKCYQQCEDISYVFIKYNEWNLNTNKYTQVQWSLERYSTTRFKRSVVFSFDDLLVSFGGIAGLFLGCSLLSGMELIYFFTLRLWFTLKDIYGKPRYYFRQ